MAQTDAASRTPSITSIFPFTIIAGTPTNLTIKGLNFIGPGSPDASKVIFHYPGKSPDLVSLPIIVVSNTIICEANLDLAESGWTATIMNGDFRSFPYHLNIPPTVKRPPYYDLYIQGPALVKEAGFAQYKAIERLADARGEVERDVTLTPGWSSDSAAAMMNSFSFGSLSTAPVTSNTLAHVFMIYADPGARTATAPVTIVDLVPCASTSIEVMTNGGFEVGSLNWTRELTTIETNPNLSHSGTNHLVLSGGLGANMWARTSFLVPANATAATLSYYVNVEVPDAVTNSPATLEVRISGTDLVEVIPSVNSAPGQYSKRLKALNVSAFADRNFTLEFRSTSGASRVRTTFRVDDVSVSAVVPAAVLPLALGINGRDHLLEGDVVQFTAMTINCDGSSSDVSPAWSIDPNAVATISPAGLVTVGSATNGTIVNVTASFNGLTANQRVTILKEYPFFSSIGIGGPSMVREDGVATLFAAANFSDGSAQAIPKPNWSTYSAWASISTEGTLMVRPMTTNQVVYVSVFYTLEGVTRAASVPVTILRNSVTPTLRYATPLTDTGVLLAWPTNFQSFKLESSANLGLGVWSAVLPQPSIVDQEFTMTVPFSGSRQFFRLKK